MSSGHSKGIATFIVKAVYLAQYELRLCSKLTKECLEIKSILPCNEVGIGAVTIANSRCLSWLCPVPRAPKCGRVACGRAFVQIQIVVIDT